jgi:leucyl aminopeptidase
MRIADIMNFQLSPLSPASAVGHKSPLLVVLLTASQLQTPAPRGRAKSSPAAEASHPALALALRAMQDQVWDGQCGAVLSLYGVQGWQAARVLVVSIGDGTRKDLKKAVSAALSACSVTQMCVLLPQSLQEDEALSTLVECIADTTYVYTSTKPTSKPRKLEQVQIGVESPKALQAALDRAVALMHGVELAKEWANRPGNHARAVDLAGVAQTIAKGRGKVSCQVLGPAEVAKLKMGSFLSVARGSEEPLRFIVLEYRGAARSQAPTVLVGKGITFDTGGISLKPGAEMDEMKFDMCGAASVLGTFEALARIGPRINVIGLIPACDNMPSGRATKPGDVVTSMSGQTIEILNTDAEGRLILCDALTYARRFKPRAVIDIATLTGACVIALGAVRHGLFSPGDDLASDLMEAGARAMDPCWRMPLDDEYGDGLKSNFADVANVAGRAAGSVTAAKFLQRFTKDLNWAHLDIAGTAWKSGAAKGATGRPVPLLVQYLLNQSEI